MYNLPPKFGSVTRANIINDPSSSNRKLSLYLISTDNNGNLSQTNQVTKNNIKNWISQYKSLNDQIEIFDPKIINFELEFMVSIDKRYSQQIVLRKCISEIKKLLADKFYIGEPLYLSRIYSILNRVDGVDDVRKVAAVNKTGGVYSNISLDMSKIVSKDGTFIKHQKIVF